MNFFLRKKLDRAMRKYLNAGDPKDLKNLCKQSQEVSALVLAFLRQIKDEGMDRATVKPNEYDVRTVACPAAPGELVVVYDDQVFVSADPEAIEDKNLASFFAIDYGGKRWYALGWATANDLVDKPNELLKWCRERLGTAMIKLRWFELAESDEKIPKYARMIGISSEGEVYVSVDALPFPEGGISANFITDAGNQYVLLGDYAKSCPDVMQDTVIIELLETLAEEQENVFIDFDALKV